MRNKNSFHSKAHIFNINQLVSKLHLLLNQLMSDTFVVRSVDLCGLRMATYCFVLANAMNAKANIGSVSAATGNAGIAAIEASESPSSNPATLGYMQGYYFATGYGSSTQDQFDGNEFNISLTDALKDTVVPSSLLYNQGKWTQKDSGQQWDSKRFQLSFGNQFNKIFSFGLGVNFQNDHWQDVSYNQTNLVVGGMMTPNRNIGFGVVFQNLFSADKKIPQAARLPQRTIVGSTFHFRKLVRFKFDVSSDQANSWQKPLLMGGVENYLNKWIIFRVGALRSNDLDAGAWSAGLGFVLPKFAFHYAYQTSAESEQLNRHSVDLAIPVW